MSTDSVALSKEQKVAVLQEFLAQLSRWKANKNIDARTYINENKQAVRVILAEVGCYKTITVTPPPAVGGLVYRDADMFDLIFNPPYFAPISANVRDMIEEAIGAIKAQPDHPPSKVESASVATRVVKGMVFVAMPMSKDDAALVDVLDAIKEAALCCGLTAQRVDDEESNERITDRILDSISRAQFVVADLTHSRPNVFYEAGYAHALGKVPVYIAREGTSIEFDLKDYPIIFFANMKTLKDGLEKRLRAIADK